MDIINSLQGIVGSAHVFQGDDAQPYLTDWRGVCTGKALAVVRPGCTAEVAAVVKLCLQERVPLVPQGGNTGLVAGATPDESGRALVLLTARLNRVRDVDPDNDTMTVEAGCLLQTVQEHAHAAGRLFPLSLAAEGSCTIGGNLATNAGGTAVLRYGNARDLALGIEVVDAWGEVLCGLRGLRKDNTGYDLRNLYIGSEGTLGIITAATLKLFPLPAARCTALLAISNIERAVALLRRARDGFGAGLTGFELMSGVCLETVTRIYPHLRIPLTEAAPWYALLELSDQESEVHARERFEIVLGEALAAGEASDAVIAENISQSKALWHLRESITLAQAQTGKSIKHDISLPISRIADFVAATDARLRSRFPGLINQTFGHLGDGNLHYNVGCSTQFSGDSLCAEQSEIYRIVHDKVHELGGSISAEHGVGQLKVNELLRYKSKQELETMARLKRALDPHGIFNPGRVLAAARVTEQAPDV